jgi:hypothetical protein
VFGLDSSKADLFVHHVLRHPEPVFQAAAVIFVSSVDIFPVFLRQLVRRFSLTGGQVSRTFRRIGAHEPAWNSRSAVSISRLAFS